jgi:hypothetical protein
MTVFRVQLLAWLLALCVAIAVAQVPSTLEFTLHHQLVHSESAKDVSPRGTISYDALQNTATFTEQSKAIDFASGKGIYRIGVYHTKENQLSPAAFTQLVDSNCRRRY